MADILVLFLCEAFSHEHFRISKKKLHYIKIRDQVMTSRLIS